VGDAPGEHAQALELLHVTHLLLDAPLFRLGSFALGDVLHHGDMAVWALAWCRHRRDDARHQSRLQTAEE